MKTSFDKLVPDHVKGFVPYIPSKPDEYLKKMYRIDHLYRLNNNENFLGPVDKATESIHSIDHVTVPKYPSGDAFSLTEKLAERFGKKPSDFLVGNGSNELITSLVKAFCEKGDNIIAADKTYAVYEWVANFSGFEAKLVDLDEEHKLSPQAVLNTITDKTKIIFICNPNNPTGDYWDKEKIINFLKAVDNRCIVVLDEAYFEFVEKEDYPNGMDLMDEFPNVVVFRTFSKMYGLASLRIGYLSAGEELIQIIERTHTRYSVNHIAQLTAWETMNDDADLIAKTRVCTANGRKMLENCFKDLNLNYIDGEANYVMVELPVSDLMMYKKLMRKGFAIRPMTNFRFPNWIRVSIVQEEVMKLFCEVFTSLMKPYVNR